MSTAGRPTWRAASGTSSKNSTIRANAPIKSVSSRDLPSHTKLKVRQVGQNTSSEIGNKDLREELEKKEKEAKKKKIENGELKPPTIETNIDADDEESEESSEEETKEEQKDNESSSESRFVS